MTNFSRFLKEIRRSDHAVALTEFALATPLVLTLGVLGLETANLALTHMQINQAAIQIADNASRIGDTSTLQNQKIYESDIHDIFKGADIQAGKGIDLFKNGRVIMSSLQVTPTSLVNEQVIGWQRCKGKKVVQSSFGKQGDNPPKGMGPAGEEVVANAGDAVMFVEIQYDYQPIATDVFISNSTITSRAAFQVRGNRDLTQIYQQNSSSPTKIAACSIFDAF